MDIFCNNFLELGDPNQKSFFGRGGSIFIFWESQRGTQCFWKGVGSASPRRLREGTQCTTTGRTSQEQKYKKRKKHPTPRRTGGWDVVG